MLPMTDSTHMPPESTMDCVEFTRDILAACEPMQEILSTMCYWYIPALLMTHIFEGFVFFFSTPAIDGAWSNPNLVITNKYLV